jgi:hypothetical protein
LTSRKPRVATGDGAHHQSYGDNGEKNGWHNLRHIYQRVFLAVKMAIDCESLSGSAFCRAQHFLYSYGPE